eukprot:TRINITY_DN37223_c0_g1_i1.p1 TRINITY_DN37223_c0_g1~~TRINITY_DN37223_c0_g1_i1.p1  ORF type:complete len:331 (+),score=26.83 TRINITY_DN37223_c0_g1_i1:87-1079(+)
MPVFTMLGVLLLQVHFIATTLASQVEDVGADESCALQVSRIPTDSFVPQCNRVHLKGATREPGLSSAVYEEVQKSILQDKDLSPPPRSRDIPTVGVYLDTVLAFATLAEMAYCGPDGSRVDGYDCKVCNAAGFSLGHPVVATGRVDWIVKDVVAYVAKITPTDGKKGSNAWKMESGCSVAFRGSVTSLDWVRDFEAWETNAALPRCPRCIVHDGFWRSWLAVKDELVKTLADMGCKPGSSEKLYITGHSLGAAIATVAAADLAIESNFSLGGVISFESPRVGNAAFGEQFSEVDGSCVGLSRNASERHRGACATANFNVSARRPRTLFRI